MSKLVLKNVTKSFGDIRAVQHFDLATEKKQFIVLAGPSGCGKSTLLHLVSGFLHADEGKIFIDDIDVTEKKPFERNISMVFQEPSLFPHMTVYENIVFGIREKLSEEEKKIRVNRICDLTGITELLNRKAMNLSGGQKQRCAIARALISKPSLFLMDEPLSSLDARMKMQLRIEIAKLYQKNNATFLYVTHDQLEAMTLADILIVMKDGCIQQMGKPMELYENPQTLFVASFLGVSEINKFQSRIKDGYLWIASRKIPWASHVQGDVISAIRSEYVIEYEFGLEGEIILIEYTGENVYVHIHCELGTIIMKRPFNKTLCQGDMIHFWFDTKYMFVFDARTEKRIYKTDNS